MLPLERTAPVPPYTSYRAPNEEGGLLVQPEPGQLPGMARQRSGEVTRGELPLRFAGVDQNQLVRSAREHLLAAAHDWTQAYSEVSLPTGDTQPLVLSGHQPSLFHPGVWLKNFALGTIARAAGGIGIHLVIDSDLCRDVAIPIPTGDASLRLETVPYDRLQKPLPYEQREVDDLVLWKSFPQRVGATLSQEIDTPLLATLWQEVVRATQQGASLGNALSIGRHRVERSSGNATLEVPWSRVCDSDPFRRFLVELLQRAEAFRDATNGALADYRTAHRIRTPVQPLPDLGKSDDWIETPFWVWSNDDPTRRPLWVRVQPDRLTLGNRSNWETPLDATTPDLLVEQLAALRQQGVKLRSRALTTTLYCRFVLTDLFLHGIGGAKYDQITDRIACRFFGIAPPPHATLTATLRLFPAEEEQATHARARALNESLRTMRYHPEQWFDTDDSPPAVQETIATKRHWITTEKTPTNAAERHRAIEQANQTLFAALADQRQHVEAKQRALQTLRQQEGIRTSREYAFCLFPREQILAKMQALAKASVG